MSIKGGIKMTIRDLLNDCIEIQGLIAIHSGEYPHTKILYEGENLRAAKIGLDMEILYLYPARGYDDGKIIIEVSEED
jgi:fructose-1,6-bisphosphatase/sedoheptulose 1,7-bisphosphatase-like protein